MHFPLLKTQDGISEFAHTQAKISLAQQSKSYL